MPQGLRLIGGLLRRTRSDESGQSGVEYAWVTAAILGGTVMSWPFLVEMINALDQYYRSIYFVLESAVP